MERLHNLVSLLPDLSARGLIDWTSGDMAVRTSRGIFTSPAGAGDELRWRLGADDFVLFPGESNASMARAGRRPHRDNRLHRAVLQALPAWNYVLQLSTPGLLGFALAGRSLLLNSHLSYPIHRGKDCVIPLSADLHDSAVGYPERIVETLHESFANNRSGAVILAGRGALIAAEDLELTVSLAQLMEKTALAMQWSLNPRM